MRRRSGLVGAVTQLLADLEVEEHPLLVLIIDDLHLVDEDEAIAHSVAQFVTHLPVWLHVVLASRHRPKFPSDVCALADSLARSAMPS